MLTTADALEAPFGVTIRTDGAKQLTFGGEPLYPYKFDAVAGDVSGDDVGSVWHVVKVGG